MDIVGEQLLESWNRQAGIINSLATLINENNRKAKPSEDGWSLDFQLCHIHETRWWWLRTISKEDADRFGDIVRKEGDQWVAIDDLEKIKSEVRSSAEIVGDLVRRLLEENAMQVGPYTHPVQFLQHMVWHEGWHAGLIMLALRLNGEEPAEIWEEKNIWEIWRGPE